MNYLTHQLLNSEELEIVRKNLNKVDLLWEDGKHTAGIHAAKVKNNLQLRAMLIAALILTALFTTTTVCITHW